MFTKLFIFLVIGVTLASAVYFPSQEDIGNIEYEPESSLKAKLRRFWHGMVEHVKDAVAKISRTFDDALDEARKGISKLKELTEEVKDKLRHEFQDIRDHSLGKLEALEKQWEDTMIEWRRKAAEGKATAKEFNDGMAQAQKGLQEFNDMVQAMIDIWSKHAQGGE